MSFQVTKPLVIIPNADGVSGDWYGYVGAIVPDGLNDDRCKTLAAKGLLVEIDGEALEGDSDAATDGTIAVVLVAVGDVPEKAAAALEAERAGKNRSTLVAKLQAIVEGDES
jgi:hypothetical protein